MPQSSHYILGLSCFYHDSAACLLKDGEIIAAASEERFTRKKHDENFPEKAINFCLQQANITIKDVDHICFYEKPILKFERLLMTYIRSWPRGLKSFLASMRTWLGQKLWLEHIIKKKLQIKKPIHYCPHHLSHAASAFYTSPFPKANVITIDGVGEWTTTALGNGKNHQLELSKEIKFPHSLGLLYTAFTYYLGFKVNSGEYKVMGLAPYGQPKYCDKIQELITLFDDGSFQLNMKYFAYEYDLRMINKKFIKLFEKPVRQPKDPLTQFHKDIAASLQKVTETAILNLIKASHRHQPATNLCLSGGVALNCVANGKILKETPYQKLYIFPAAGDAGGAVGAALYLHHHILKNPKSNKHTSPYLGPEYSNQEIQNFLDTHKIKYQEFTKTPELAKEIAQHLNHNKVIGLFQGRMEFGPRALGNRSIIADPRQKENWQRVNLKIKFRESFRPFAPSILHEKLTEFYDIETESPYMLLTAPTKKPQDIPATTHVDKSARIQSVTKKQNPTYHQIISAFNELTGCPVIINTSFNVRGEPIVCSYEDAFKCFLRTDMDVLVLNNFIITKEQNAKEKIKENFILEEFAAD